MKMVYLSGPITGLAYDDARYGWREDFTYLLGPNIGVLSPMRHEGHLAEIQEPMSVEALKNFEKENHHLFSHHKMIVAKDELDIEQCDIMVVNLLGAEKVSQGTVYEMGYARGVRKPMVVVMEPFGNPHTSPFITETPIKVVNTLNDAAKIVNSLLSEGL